MEKFRHYFLTTICVLGALVVFGLFTQHPAQSVTGAPVPVQVANTVPIATSDVSLAAKQPFQKNITISIANGNSAGTDNGNLNGTQSLPIPAGKRLVIQTVSFFRAGTLQGTVQLFLNLSVAGSYSNFPVTGASANGATYVGATQPMTCYADPGTSLLVNAFRNGTSGGESETVTIAGYLVDLP